MAAYEIKRTTTVVDYLEVDASNIEEAIDLVQAGRGKLAGGMYIPTIYEGHFLFESESADVDEDEKYFEATHPYVD